MQPKIKTGGASCAANQMDLLSLCADWKEQDMVPNLSSEQPNDKQFIEQLEVFLAKLVYDDEFSGVVLFAKHDQPLFKKAYGLANKSFEVPNKVDTKFNIASIGKMFTEVAVAQLAEKGKLSFEDPVSKYLSSAWLKPKISEKNPGSASLDPHLRLG